MKEQALIYLGQSDEYKQQMITLLEEFDFQYTFLNDSDLDQSVTSLFEKEKESTISNKLFSFNFIFFKNLDHDKILKFYKQCEQLGSPFSHKAVMTEHNQHWIMSDLLKEIEEEHEFFQMWSILNGLLREANDCNPQLYTQDSYEPYKTAFINAYIFVKQPNPDKELIKKLIDDILIAKENLIVK